jgi:tRNA pseudouridine38-40 synthase
VRRVRGVTIARRADVVTIAITANAFLHQMVRSIVGTLVSVGDGRIEPGAMSAIVAARDRAAAGNLAPSRGLTLERVTYGRRS